MPSMVTTLLCVDPEGNPSIVILSEPMIIYPFAPPILELNVMLVVNCTVKILFDEVLVIVNGNDQLTSSQPVKLFADHSTGPVTSGFCLK